jgi:5-methylcytosine-specific restriction endonuclease McrBC GTP-binding regulatory subunit McrB
VKHNYEKSYNELGVRDKALKQAENTGEGEIGTAAAVDNTGGYLSFCTFHPAFGYEEFIEGYRPKPGQDGTPGFVLQDGLFKKLCQRAAADPTKTYVLVIDEINRGNIPRIFGELITLIEKDKRRKILSDRGISLTLAASGDIFYVPDNLLIIGTMNTADCSIALLDIALRWRFGFYELMPLYELLDSTVVEGINLGAFLRELNRRR